MRCPFCADEGSSVIDSRLGRDGSEIRRRRECGECGRRFTTRERVDDVLPKVCKRDERREDFQREKLLAAVQQACHKRPVSADALGKIRDQPPRFPAQEHERRATRRERGSQRGQAVMEPPTCRTAERLRAAFEHIDRQDRPLGRGGERGIVGQAQVLTEPDDRRRAQAALGDETSGAAPKSSCILRLRNAKIFSTSRRTNSRLTIAPPGTA